MQNKPWERNWSQGQQPQSVTVGTPDASIPLDRTIKKQQIDKNAREAARDPIDTATAETDLRNKRRQERDTLYEQTSSMKAEFNKLPAVVAYTKALPAYISGITSANTPGGDLNLISAFAKIMDPDSAVREGESETIASGDTVRGQWEARLNKELTDQGGQFRPQYRQQLRQEMRRRMGALNQAFIAERVRYKQDAQAFGIDPIRVVGEHPGRVHQSQEEAAFGKKIGELDFYGNPLKDEDSATPGGQFTPISPTSLADYAAGIGKPQIQPDGSVQVPQSDGTTTTYSDQATYQQRMIEERLAAQYGRGTEAFNAAYRKQFGENPPLEIGISDDSSGDLSELEERRDTAWGKADATVRGAADMATLGIADPLSALVRSAFNDKGFAANWADERRINAADEKANPWWRVGGQFAGGLPTAYRLGQVGATALPSRPLLGTALAETAGGTLYGGVTNPGDPIKGAVSGAAISLAGNQIGQRILGPIVDRATARVLGQQDPVVRQLALSSPDMNYGNATTLLVDARRLSVPMALADADPTFRALAGSATRIAPAGREFAEQVIAPRGRGQAERAIAAVERDFATPTNMIEARKAYRQQARADSRPFYEEAFSRPAPVDAEIDAMLQTPGGRRALNQAVVIAQNEGRDPTALGFDLNDIGEVVTVRNPSFETLHMVKRGLDSVVEGARGPTGVLNTEDPAIAALDRLRARFRGRLGELDENYAAGNSAYAAQMRNRDALDFGYDATRPSVSPDVVAEALLRMPAGPMQRGYSTGLVEQIERMRLSGNPYEAVYGSPAQMEKAATLFPEGVENFGRQAQLEQQLARTQYETLGGSPTAARRIADEQYGPSVMDDVLIDTVTGQPGSGIVRRLARAGADRYRMGLQGPQRARTIAELLLAPDPDLALTAVERILARQAIRDQSLGAGAVIGSSIALPMAGGE